jgi:pimeloyl-ACP methyl ester carboxylesterase
MKNFKSGMMTVLVTFLLIFNSQQAVAQNNHQTAQTQFVEVNGTKYAYRSYGNNSATPLIFLQHFTGTMDNWDPEVTDGFAKNHHIILFDNKGVGSSTGETPSAINEMAVDAYGFITALGYKKVDLLGFSLGGFIAQRIAIEHPELVHKLILAGTGPQGGDITDNGPVLENKEKRTPLEQILFLFFDPTPTSQAKGKEFIQRISLRKINRDTDTRVASILAQNDAINKYKGQKDDTFKHLDKITIPVLVVNGVHDAMIPSSNSFVLETHLKNAKLILYPDSGHGAIFQYHEDFIKQAEAFLRKGDR